MPRLPAAGSVTAAIIARSAVAPAVTKDLLPSMTQPPSGRGRARVRIAAASDPAWGSVSRIAPDARSARQLRQPSVPLGRRPVLLDRRRDRRVVRGHHVRHPAVRGRDLLHREHVGHEVGSGTAELR